MRIRPNDSESNEAQLHTKMLDGASKTYRSFKDYVSIQEEDTIGVMLLKLGLHLVGLLFMLFLSPFFIAGMILAFIVVF